MEDNTLPDQTSPIDQTDDSSGAGSDISLAANQNLRLSKGANTLRRRSVLGRGLTALMSSGPVSVRIDEQDLGVPGFSKTRSAGAKDAADAAPRAETPTFSALERASDEVLEGGMTYLAIDRLAPSRVQPRQNFNQEEISGLAKSIAETGLLQPIIVRRTAGEAGPLAGYEIVAGERRWRAAKAAGLRKIPALVRQLSDREALEFGIIENVQRADLNPVEEAQAYQRLISEFNATQEEIARTAGKDRTSVANALRLLKLPAAVQQLLVHGEISSGHGRALLVLDSPEMQTALAKRICSENLSVRAAEQIVNEVREIGADAACGVPNGVSPVPSAPQRGKSPAVLELEERIRRALGTKVNLSVKKSGKGELRISFFSAAELESLLERLGA